MRTKRIVVLAGYPFPIGMAATTRIIAYASGLQAHGVSVEVVNFSHVAPDAEVYPDSGTVDGVRYTYAYHRIGSKNKFKRRVCDNIISVYRSIRLIAKMNREQPVDYVFLSFDSVLNIMEFVVPLYLMRLRLVFIGDEYPIPIREQLKESIPRWKYQFYRFMSRFLTARVLMTENLKKYYDEIYPLPTYLLSNIVNEQRFPENSAKRKSSSYLCYMGNLELAKDNVDNIIRAFALVQGRFPDLVLRIYGLRTPKKKSLTGLVEELDLQDRVEFMGRISSDEVPAILQSATLLVSSQPLTKRAQGGFPTKLGEYLLSGTPALFVDVGEISQYVRHGKEIWLAQPCDPIDFAEKMAYILEHYPEAETVARNGREFVLAHFTADKATAGLVSFFESFET